MYERLRRLTARAAAPADAMGRPAVGNSRTDLVYRPVWRPVGPDQFDALITAAAH